MSTLRDKFTSADAQRIADMGCTTETALMPLTVRRLVELIEALQARCDALEARQPPSLVSRLLGRKPTEDHAQ